MRGSQTHLKGPSRRFAARGRSPLHLVSYARVSTLLLDCEGVEDVRAFTLVGAADEAGLSRWERDYGLADRSGEDSARRRAHT